MAIKIFIYTIRSCLPVYQLCFGAGRFGRFYSAMSCLLLVFSHSFSPIAGRLYAKYARYALAGNAFITIIS